MKFRYEYIVCDDDDSYGCIYHSGYNKKKAMDIFKKIKSTPGNWVIFAYNRMTGVESRFGRTIPKQEIANGVLR